MLNLKIGAYFQLLRINHWFKNLFLTFGIFAGIWYLKIDVLDFKIIFLGFLAFLLTSLISSANYIINQITDAKFDIKHESKLNRPIPSGRISINKALLLFLFLVVTSLIISFKFYSLEFSIVLMLFILAGFAYNVSPIRLKDIAYVDVLAESINNPIRFLLGWFVVVGFIFPPVMILLLTWSVGAIFMTAKRYDELMYFGQKLNLYRETFKKYSLKSLAQMLYIYSFLSMIFLGVVSFYYDRNLFFAVPVITVFIIWLIKKITTGKAEARNVESFVLKPEFLLYSIIILLFILFLILK